MNRDQIRNEYARHVDKVNRSTDREINEAMDEILRKQRQVNVLRPAPDKFRPIRRPGSTP